MKTFILKNIKNLAIIILIVALLISLQKCQEQSNLRESNLSAMNDSIKHYKNKLGTITAEKKVEQMTKSDFENYVLENDKKLAVLTKEFSKVRQVIKASKNVRIDSIKVPFETKIPCDFKVEGDYQSEWYNLGYKITPDGLTIEPFNTWNEQTVITGFKRKWFLGKQYMTTDITNSNPFLQTDEIRTIEVVIPKKFYDTRAFNIGIGILGGALLFK